MPLNGSAYEKTASSSEEASVIRNLLTGSSTSSNNKTDPQPPLLNRRNGILHGRTSEGHGAGGSSQEQQQPQPSPPPAIVLADTATSTDDDDDDDDSVESGDNNNNNNALYLSTARRANGASFFFGRSSSSTVDTGEEAAATSTTTTTTPPADSDGDDGDGDDDDEERVLLNDLDDSEDEFAAIALLKVIFPRAGTETLRRQHRAFCHRLGREQQQQQQSPQNNTTTTTSRMLRHSNCNSASQNGDGERTSEQENKKKKGAAVVLPDDFLRLPTSVAVRRPVNGSNNNDNNPKQWHYVMIADLERRSVAQHERACAPAAAAHDDDGCWDYVTTTVSRDGRSKGGLGISLVEQQGTVRVFSVVGEDDDDDDNACSNDCDGTRQRQPPKRSGSSPASRAGVRRGDVLIGVNGAALVETVPPHGSNTNGGRNNNDSSINSRTTTSVLVRHAAAAIRASRDPVVLHLQRPARQQSSNRAPLLHAPPRSPPPPSVVLYEKISATTPSLLDASDLYSEQDDDDDEVAASAQLDASFAAASSDLSDHSSSLTPVLRNSYRQHVPRFIRLLAERRALRTPRDEMEATRALQNFNFRARQWDELASFQIPAAGVFVPLCGVRKALSVRIVNTFQDDKDTAYTIWVYDVESGNEWYAPVRFLRDFEDLRTATLSLCPTIAQIPFPRSSSRSALALFRSPSRDGGETSLQRENKCRQLEFFLRTICAMIYTEKLHPCMSEIAIHVQSFLGCEEQVFGSHEEVSGPPAMIECIDDPSVSLKENEALQNRMRLRLKRSLQLYTYRLFLLDVMAQLVGNFVDAARTQGPRLQEIEALEAEGRGVLKAQAMHALGRIQAFIDNLQDLILEGCTEDFQAIGRQPRYSAIHGLIQESGKAGGGGYWDCLVREAVREQVEIEVYVPLRCVVSRWLVHGWRHEDMEVQFRIKELRKRPQEFFRIAKGGQRPDWSSVSKILNEGVGLSTLPCVKLHAIVDAAREIFRIFSEHNNTKDDKRSGHHQPSDVAPVSPKEIHLGADDFLPIFIFCVVQAEMERPCALCVLLRTLCDRINKIGEIGYYLQTFEAAIAHCQEIDLTEDREEMQSFLSIPLNDN